MTLAMSKAVEDLLNDSWELYGNLIIMPNLFFQALIHAEDVVDSADASEIADRLVRVYSNPQSQQLSEGVSREELTKILEDALEAARERKDTE